MVTRFLAAVVAVSALCGAVWAQAPTADQGLRTILAPNAQLEKLGSGYGWAEGPVYDRKTNAVLFSDQGKSKIHRYDCKTGQITVFRDNGIVPNGNTFDAEGRLLGCEHNTRRIARTDADGRVVTLAYLYDFKRLNSPNDLVVKSDGTIYFTDPPYGLPRMSEGKEQPVNGVYRLARTGEVTLLTTDFTMPNGLAFSPDEKTLYVDDTERGVIRAYDVQPDGTLARGRELAKLRAEGKRGAPDGMKVDANGNIFCTGPGGIWVLAPTGTVLGVIETPETAANCAFGDKDGKTLYITANSGFYRIRLASPGPLTGKK